MSPSGKSRHRSRKISKMTDEQRIPWKRLYVEAAAIVASILLAFAIDAWWEDRQERVLEQQYLASLKADFQADIEELHEAIALAKSRAQLGRLLISSIDKDRVEGDPN